MTIDEMINKLMNLATAAMNLKYEIYGMEAKEDDAKKIICNAFENAREVENYIVDAIILLKKIDQENLPF